MSKDLRRRLEKVERSVRNAEIARARVRAAEGVIDPRDAVASELRASGWSIKNIAKALRCGETAVHNQIKRHEENLAAMANGNTLAMDDLRRAAFSIAGDA